MGKSMKTRDVYEFREGDRFTLDDIYAIQGLGGGDWWERTGEDTAARSSDLSEDLVCTRDIKIVIIISSPDAPGRRARPCRRPRALGADQEGARAMTATPPHASICAS